MKLSTSLAGLLGLSLSVAATAAPFTVQNYNDALPIWGVSWAPGADATNGYYPSFYTGFAPRSAYPNRVHVKLARGNQTRVSTALDETTVNDYLFDLVKRYEFYQRVAGPGKTINTAISGAALDQLKMFNATIESDAYGILPFVAKARKGEVTPEQLYTKSLEVMAALNPGRVHNLRINLTNEYKKWQSQMKAMFGENRDTDGFFARNPDKAVTAINGIVFGRVNYTGALTADKVVNVASAAETALVSSEAELDQMVWSANDAFKLYTGDKFNFRTLFEGRWVKAIECESPASCFLTYPEFTAVYPTGSVKAQTRDQFGNSIAQFATPGLWSFIDRTGGRGVDNIRDEAFYGWAPKMDYEDIGNGFHNPAVRFTSVSREVKETLGLPASHTTLWSVMRGGVSHGCSRLPLGHVWEMRHLFPVESSRMSQIFYFGSNPQDFDVYDVDGDGKPELIGVEYLISYGLAGTSELGRREGADLEIGSANKLAFYRNLYGAQNVFTVDANGRYWFKNPQVSLPSALDYQKKKVTTRLVVNDTLPLYEAPYERDKVQFYSARGLNKKLVRLMGRVRGCAPTTNKNECGEAAFDQEAAELLRR